MAQYQVTTVVTCATQAEFEMLLTHLAEHDVSQTDPAPFASCVIDHAAKKVTLMRTTAVSSEDWS